MGASIKNKLVGASLGGTISLDNLNGMLGAQRLSNPTLPTYFVGVHTLQTLSAPVTSLDSEIYINVQYVGGGSANASVITFRLRRDSAAGPILQTLSETVLGGFNQTINYRESPPSGTTTTYVITMELGAEGGGGAQVQISTYPTLNGLALYTSVDNNQVATAKRVNGLIHS